MSGRRQLATMPLRPEKRSLPLRTRLCVYADSSQPYEVPIQTEVSALREFSDTVVLRARTMKYAPSQFAGSVLFSQALPDFLSGESPRLKRRPRRNPRFQFPYVSIRNWQLIARIRNAIPNCAHQIQPLDYTSGSSNLWASNQGRRP